ncbi:MAG: glycoside hydrolase family 28 protein, partial [Firmicutes bacterium]|nr:glycoside hydrolase family 28 protein [Bacillota bacterium]
MASLKDYGHLAAGGLWTGAFRAAMEALSSRGGGTLIVPPGRYETGPVR